MNRTRLVDFVAHLPGRARRHLMWRWKLVCQYLERRLIFHRLRRQSKLAQVTRNRAVVFSPHQDDETLGCGGVIAAKRHQHTPVAVVFLTDGGGCLIDDTDGSARQTIRAIRRLEALKALQILGVDDADVFFLDYPDSKLADLRESERLEIISKISTILRQLDPQEVFLPFRNDRHRDHRATHTLVKAAVDVFGKTPDLWHYFTWSLWEPSHLAVLTGDEKTRLCRVEMLRRQWRQKKAALKQYRSQYQPVSEHRLMMLPEDFVRFLSSPHELFLIESPAQ